MEQNLFYIHIIFSALSLFSGWRVLLQVSIQLQLLLAMKFKLFSFSNLHSELGTMIKKSGADYAYIMTTFGPFLAFIRLWIECMIVRPCSQAIVALTFSVCEFSHDLKFIPLLLIFMLSFTDVLKPFFPDCEPPNDAARLLAVCCICEFFKIEF